MVVGGLSYLTTVRDLKDKISKISRLSSSKYKIHLISNGHEVTKDHCFLAHFGIAEQSMIEANFEEVDKDAQESLLSKTVPLAGCWRLTALEGLNPDLETMAVSCESEARDRHIE